MTVGIATIRAEPHAEVGTILMRDADAIIEQWCERARAEQPGAARLHHDVLKNELRDFLRAMGSGIRQAGQNPREHRDNAIEHGEQRWDHGWSIGELVRDYQILHTLLLEHLSQALHRTLTQRETMSIAVFIHDAIAASIAAYVANRDHELRTVERANGESLQEAYRRKDAFLAVVVHELRNPVSPIATSAHTLSLLLPDAEGRVREAISVIRRQSHHLSRLLDDLTDL
ncbi:MAG TPA: histidine kinase dimerization/phospho-acceptor domain-containing protein, partial [Gemmatimonadaceae bacterium]